MKFRLKIFGIAIGIALIAWGAEERKLNSLCKPVAARLTCQQLGDKGVTDNAHVILTDFAFTQMFVHTTKEHSDHWSQIWVPAVPIDSPYMQKLAAVVKTGGKPEDIPLPKPVNVIVTSRDVPDLEAWNGLDSQEQLEGLVVNAISHIDGDTKKLLEESYGDISHAQILEVGRKPEKLALAYGGMIAGALLSLFSVLSFLTVFTRKQPAVPKAA